MIEKKPEKIKHERDDGVELENQFILRLPEEPAKALHEALQTGNLKDRISIKMDADLRYGEVRFDHWLLHTKILDLPTVIECLKTIDNKSFYKSADICQVMICKEEPDTVDPEKESPNKGKKKDPNKVEKKYLWPHGITPPCKNVRKRRFRKTLKKKNVEAPEIEKEVKRLLRIDNDAVKVDYEIISEDMDKRSLDNSKEYDGEEDDYNDETLNERDKTMNDSSSQKDINVESDGDDDGPSSSARPHHHHHHHGGVGEHDIFGEAVSSSDDDDEERHVSSRLRDLEDTSRLSADDSRMSDFSLGGGGADDGARATGSGLNNSKEQLSEFNRSMFGSPKGGNDAEDLGQLIPQTGYYAEDSKRYDEDYSNEAVQLSSEQLNAKIAELRRQNEELKVQQSQKAQEISSIQNPTLKQRMQETLDNLLIQMVEKEMEIKDYENML